MKLSPSYLVKSKPPLTEEEEASVAQAEAEAKAKRQAELKCKRKQKLERTELQSACLINLSALLH